MTGLDRGQVVIVDSYAPARRLAPEFRKAGYACVRVQSTPGVPMVYASAPVPLEDYVDNILHEGDVGVTLAAVAAHEPVAVVAGSEVGVEFADLLSERLGLPSNGTALSEARRHKYRMVETIKQAGLRGARQLLVSDAEQLSAWHQEIGGRVVIKPVRSAGGDGVAFCDTPEESVKAYLAILGATNIFSNRNETVVAQEYLPGTEYMVNTVSRDGRHHVCDVWRTSRISANGLLDLSDTLWLIPGTGPVVDQLASYTGQVLDALEVRHGPAHVEIRLTPSGPCIVEVGARLPGGDMPYYAGMAIGESQLEWTVDAYVRPERFHARCDTPYRLRRFCARVGLISPYDRTLRAYRDLETIESLESFHDMQVSVAPGQRLHRTVNDLTYPIFVTLAHELEELVIRDHGTIRYLDGESFYEVE
jgi:biotin carboxylase